MISNMVLKPIKRLHTFLRTGIRPKIMNPKETHHLDDPKIKVFILFTYKIDELLANYF